MMPLPLTQDLVLVGGGHTHALVLRELGMQPVPGLRLTVVNPGPTAPYTGMLPGFVAGHYNRDALEIDLIRLARFAGARIILDAAEGVDTDTKHVILKGGRRLRYDTLSINVGAVGVLPDLDGFAEHGIPAKPLGPFADRWTAFLAKGGGPIGVLGGGVAGAELALAMGFALKSAGHPAKITIIEPDAALSGLGAAAKPVRDALAASGITVLEGVEPRAVGTESITVDGGERVASTFTVGAAGVRAPDWLANTGLRTENGYLIVDRYLRTSDPSVFAAGDCVHLSGTPRPKAGVFAVRAAPVLTTNLRAAVTGRQAWPFKPQSDFLKLISLGEKRAVALKWGRAVTGNWVWRWKDRIDQTFMNRLNVLPMMGQIEAPDTAAALGLREALSGPPTCAGCGAKVAPSVLDGAISGLDRAGDDAAILPGGGRVITTDTLRSITDDPAVFARIATLHALGDIWAMGARPDTALVSPVLPPLSEALQRDWLGEVVAATRMTLAEEGAEIIGGHTTTGAEFSLGLTITGVPKAKPVTLGGAKTGDVLILTRAIGSGTLLAGEMAGATRGADVAALWALLQASQGDAAAVLAGAHAMTDVTGFGLAGHLWRMLQASGVAASVDLSSVPIMPGVLALAEAGIRSSLFAGNQTAVPGIHRDDARTALMFDPQTAGGVLASVPEDQAADLETRLRDLGHQAVRIGKVRDGPPAIIWD